MTPIKWVFAFNGACEEYYEDLIRVSVMTARQNTPLEAICLYDGEETELTEWIRRQGVQIIPCQSSFLPQLEKLAVERKDPMILRVGAGAFLRLELPRIAQELGWKDEFVFYTDCDVIFMRDPSPLLTPLHPHFFAATPETFMDKPLHMNSGTMWMNLPVMESEREKLNAFTRDNFAQVVDSAWDQGALRVYFDPLHRFFWRVRIPDVVSYGLMTRLPFRTFRWEDLPLELNWKPYWGDNSNAVVVHFHGLKPYQRTKLKEGTLPDFISIMETSAFFEYAGLWDEWLEKAKAA